MRFVPLNCIRSGMISGNKFVKKNGEVLVYPNSIIQDSDIERVRRVGYPGIYVKKDESRDKRMMEKIRVKIRMIAAITIQDNYSNLGNGNMPKDYKKVIKDLIDEILSDKQFMDNMIDMKVYDDDTFYHSVNVGVLSIVIGMYLGLGKKQLFNLGLAGLMHDIGKVFIPKEILNKPDKLSYKEFEVMKTHSYKGYKYIKKMFNFPDSTYKGVLEHHERFDGSGYPNSIVGPRISLFGRIIAVADVYDALTFNRPYRKAMSPSEATEIIMGGSNFDPQIVKAFKKIIL